MAHGYRPVICKIEIKNPNKNGTKISNRNLLRYIATREGVDLTRVDTLLDAINENYDLTEQGEQIIASDAPDNEYLKYMSFRPRSHGLFGNIDTEDFKEVSKKLDAISNENRTVYRGVISLSELDGKALGYNNTAKWNLYLHSVMPDIASTLGLSPNDMTWVAAFHAEQTHPHVHFMLWDNKDKVKNAFITNSQHLACREICQNAMFTEENEAIIKQITEAERMEYYAIQNLSRKKITEYFKEVDFDTVFGMEQDVPGAVTELMPGRLSAEEHSQLNLCYENILKSLPGKGRKSYQFMPPECKAYIDQVTELFLKRPDVKLVYEQYINAVEEIHKSLGKTGKEIKVQCDNSISELYSRTGNIILKAVFEIKNSVLGLDNVGDPILDGCNSEFGYGSDDEKEKGINDYEMLYEENSEFGCMSDQELEQIVDEELQATDDYDTVDRREKEIRNYGKVDSKRIQYDLDLVVPNRSALALIKLGIKCSNKFSDSYDPEKAVSYLEKAIAKGYKDDKGKICLCFGKVYADEEYEKYDIGKAIVYFEQASNKGNASAMVELGRCCLYGKGIKKDNNAALEWMLKAAELGDIYAEEQLGVIYSNKNLDVYDPNKAVLYLESVLMKGYNDKKGINLTRLGRMYADEEYEKYDMRKAIDYFSQAAEKENTAAMFKLAKCYQYGIGVEKDKEAGKEWLIRAAGLGDVYAEEQLKKNDCDDFKNFSRVLLRQVFSSMQQTKAKAVMKLQEFEFKTNSKQVKKEEYLHRN